jgi:predicted RNA-binding Zn ribbon-like protein
MLSAKEARELIRKAKREPSKAEDVRKHAIELREVIYHVFSDVAKRKRPAKKDVAVINRDLSRTMAQSLLLHTKDGFIWSTSEGKRELDFMLGPIVRSAA